MAVFVSLFENWYVWLVGLPVIGALIALWQRDAAKAAWRKIVGIFKLLWNAEKILEKGTSPESRVCPDCGKRMKVIQARFNTWWYKCEACNKAFPYPAPTAKL